MTGVRRIVDAHHHLWDLAGGGYPGLSGPRADPAGPLGKGALQRDYLVPDYLADAADLPLVASVHVEAAFDPARPVDETIWLTQQAAATGFPDAIVARARLEDAGLTDVLDAHQASPLVRGVRQMLDWQSGTQRPSALLSDARWLRGLEELGRRGLSFDLQVVPAQLAEAAMVAADHPDITFVLDHGGYHLLGAEADWLAGLPVIAAAPNMVVKASGYQVIDPWHGAGLRDYVRRLLDAFGPQRTMFASNFPFDGRSITMSDLVERVDAALDGLDADERDAFWAGTADRVYRLNLDTHS